MTRRALTEQFVSEARALGAGVLVADLRTQLSQAIREEAEAAAKAAGREYTPYTYVVEVFPAFIIYRGPGLPSYPDEDEDTYWKRGFTVSAGQVALAEQSTVTKVTRAWVELAKEARADAEAQLAGRVAESVLPGLVSIREAAATATLAGLQVEDVNGLPTIRSVVLIQAGESKNRPRRYPARTLERDGKGVFEGTPAYVTNHNPDQKTLTTMVGTWENVRWESARKALVADLVGFSMERETLQKAVEAHGRLGADIVGVSIDTAGNFSAVREGAATYHDCDRLVRTDYTAVDIVTHPAAGGRFGESKSTENAMRNPFLAALTVSLLAGLTPAAVREACTGLTDDDIRESNPALASSIIEKKAQQDPAPPAAQPPAQERQNPPAGQVPAGYVSVEEAQRLARETATTAAREAVTSLQQEQETERQAQEARRQVLDTVLNRHSDLGATLLGTVRAHFARETNVTEEGVTQYVTSLRQGIGRDFPGRPFVPSAIPAGEGVIQEAHDKHKLALQGFFRNGTSQRDAKGDYIPAFTSFRYQVLPMMAGINPNDPEEIRESMVRFAMRGRTLYRYMKQVAARETVDTGTWEDAWADVMYKEVLAAMRSPLLLSWQRWARTISFNDFRDKKFTRIGGYGKFEQLNEGQPYNYVATPGEEKFGFGVDKYGGLEKLTWESIVNDDVQAIGRIPGALGRGWSRTVYDIVYGAFRDNPTMEYDGQALFLARAGQTTNIVDAALSKTAWATARQQMRKQTELSSGFRNENYTPRFLLFQTPDLDETSWQILGQNVNPTTNADSTMENFYGMEGVERIPVQYPTTEANPAVTSTRWDVLADPAEVTVGMAGFLGGRYEADVFTQDGEQSEGMFNQDIIKFKLRGTAAFVFADHRAIQRGNQ